MSATVARALAAATRALQAAGIESAGLDAELLLAHALGVERPTVLAHPERTLSADLDAHYRALVARRADHEPVAYLIGRRWFYGLAFEVNPAVLIPRPETEMLVEAALAWLRARSGATTLVDVGTGSGAIAVAIAVADTAHAPPAVRIYAVDASPEALAVARRNAARQRVDDRITFLCGDLLDPVPAAVDLVLANLPYIPTGDIETLMPDVRDYEPRAALDGGPDGLRVIERLLAQAADRLRPGAALMLEIGYDQGASAAALARRYFPAARVAVRADLAGRDRVVVVEG